MSGGSPVLAQPCSWRARGSFVALTQESTYFYSKWDHESHLPPVSILRNRNKTRNISTCVCVSLLSSLTVSSAPRLPALRLEESGVKVARRHSTGL